MADVLQDAPSWCREGTRFAVAKLVQTGSSPARTIGVAMAVCEAGDVIDGNSGGCVEDGFYVMAQERMDNGHLHLLTCQVSYGRSALSRPVSRHRDRLPAPRSAVAPNDIRGQT